MDRHEQDMSQRVAAAEDELAGYEFGEGVTVVAQGGWNTSDPDDLTKIVYFEDDDAPEDADSERISFHVRFGLDGRVSDAYGLLMSSGAEIGVRASAET